MNVERSQEFNRIESEFLAQYDVTKFERPSITVDVVMLTVKARALHTNSNQSLTLLSTEVLAMRSKSTVTLVVLMLFALQLVLSPFVMADGGPPKEDGGDSENVSVLIERLNVSVLIERLNESGDNVDDYWSRLSEKDQKTTLNHIEAILTRLEKAGDKGAMELWLRLSPDDREAVRRYITPTKMSTEISSLNDVQSMNSGYGCWQGTAEAASSNWHGLVLFRYFQRIEWCYTGYSIDTKFRTRWGEAYHFPWTFLGHVDDSEAGGEGQTYYRSWSQGQFAACTGIWSCFLYDYLEVDHTVYGNGDQR